MRACSWAGVGQLYVGGQRYVTGDLLPHKVECVDIDPEIRAGRSDGVDARCGVEVATPGGTTLPTSDWFSKMPSPLAAVCAPAMPDAMQSKRQRRNRRKSSRHTLVPMHDELSPLWTESLYGKTAVICQRMQSDHTSLCGRVPTQIMRIHATRPALSRVSEARPGLPATFG